MPQPPSDLPITIRSSPTWWQRIVPAADTIDVEDPPLRAELFSAEQIAAHGERLARIHVLSDAPLPDRLLARLDDNERLLVGVAKQLAVAADADRRYTPAAEWLLDNFYLIEEEIRTARRHLPRGYSRKLPRLALVGANGAGAGLPRVYDLALQAISHGDGQVGRGPLTRFVGAYESVQPLLLGELWAFPIMLRLALIENLRRIAVRVEVAHVERATAGAWADSMVTVAESSPSDLILVIADMARSGPPLTNAFVAEFARRLQGRGAALMLALQWIEQRLAEVGQTIEQLVQLEARQQAANQVSVSNSIGSLRLLGAMNWRDFVESLSSVEQTLRGDPAEVYALMDFNTRDRYRHAVEEIAALSPMSETDIAKNAVALAEAAAASAEAGAAGDSRRRHVGSYLIGAGRPRLEHSVRARLPRADVLARKARAWAVPLYAGAIGALTLVLVARLMLDVHPEVRWPWWVEALFALGLAFALSQLAVSLVNWLVTLFVQPQTLPRMDYSAGIAPESRTLVVVPTMLGSTGTIESLVEALEVRFLANRDPHLHYGLLTDFHDAAEEHVAGDDALVEFAAARIAALNEKYAAGAAVDAFFLFHRPRRWNARERVWMGYERKRGKLGDLNALLRGKEPARGGERFSRIVGRTEALRSVRYVITLDSDTQLPRDAAAKIVATMAHPLNRPRFGIGRKRDIVVDGYGILQPRVGLSLPSTNRSGYARLYGGEPGIDPYTRAVSDVYQDLFGEGSFIGKGIYDVDAFERSLHDRLPENRILSHDLIEGCHARSGLVSDVQLLEESPTRYSADVARRYRWIRGDWQLLGWLHRRVRTLPGAPRNPLSLLSRAKILDNLRRSLVPAAIVATLLAAWALLPPSPMWLIVVLAILGGVPLAALVVDTLRRPLEPAGGGEPSVAAPVSRQAHNLLIQVAQSLACLPHEAAYSLAAIARTLWRVTFSKRRLLEWRPSADVRIAAPPGSIADLLHDVRTMAAGPLLALASAAGLAIARPEALPVALPVLLLWLLSPLLVWWIDRPLVQRLHALSAAQALFARRLARRTWAFFDAHVGAADNHLPPDNMQEHPVARIAHRTSPTNMGFALLAALAARDFGYLTVRRLLARIDAAMTTMEAMERHRGHFYNWYDTQTLQPLRPRYVSTVDSGNLAAQLLTLRAGLLALVDLPLLAPSWLEGVHDTLGVLRESLDTRLEAMHRRSIASVLSVLDDALALLRTEPPQSVADWRKALRLLHRLALELRTTIDAGAAPQSTAPGEDSVATSDGPESVAAATPVADDDEPTGADDASYWVGALLRDIRDGLEEIEELLPADDDTVGLPLPTLRALAGRASAGAGAAAAVVALRTLEDLAERAGALAEMDQSFLYDEARHLMTIGYNVDERRPDAGYYDLLASEARLGVFVAIAQGRLAQESWFALGRLLTSAAGEPVLLSWSGSMFEYLMPMLVMPSYPHTLLDHTCRGAVRRHIEYGAQRGVPWGVSESGYNATDTALNYQYRAFGVPGLGLKRGLAEDLVVAPYASMMALMVAPEQACTNLQRLAAEGASGRYGFYEAVDYTASRVPRGQVSAIVRSYMAHHQGMGLLALAHLLLDRPMQRHFEADPRLQATLLLLQERVPRITVFQADIDERAGRRSAEEEGEQPSVRVVSELDAPTPEVQLLSNGRYHVMVTDAGGGYSRWKDLAVSRWHEDATVDGMGSFCYLRDLASGALWSTAHQPTRKRATRYEAIFSEGRAEFRRRDEGIDTHTEIVVSPEDDIELRRLRITNSSRAERTIEVTTYSEVVLAPPIADVLHPAFSKLFVQTEILERPAAVLCTRRRRSPEDSTPWMFQVLAVHGVRGGSGDIRVGPISHETDRARFIGRGRSLELPQALDGRGPLSNTVGSVLDPIAASRFVLTIASDQTVTVDIVTGMADTREACVAMAGKYQDRRLADRVFELAWTHAHVVLRQLNASEAEAQLYARLAGAVLHAHAALRADSSVLTRNRRGQSGLWGYAISGDLPIVLLQIGSADNIELVRQLVQAHAWWRLKGLAVDLVIWNEERDIYRQRLQEQIMGLIVGGAGGAGAHVIDRPGGIFVRHVEQIAPEDRTLLQAVARAVFSDTRGTLAEQVQRRPLRERRPAAFVAVRSPEPRVRASARSAHEDEDGAAVAGLRRDGGRLILENGSGGFSADGREYVVAPPAGERPPAPWVNVLANPRFGSVVSEAGSAYTWCENAHELRLTPWHNDPVGDASGEVLYLRDEETGQVWCPTSLPAPAAAEPATPFVARHGFGSSVFEHTAYGIRSELEVFVALDAAVKFYVLRLTNASGRPRKLSVTAYVEWVLGDLRAKTAPHIITKVQADTGALYARNPYSNDYADWIGFLDVDDAQLATGSFTCDRAEFIGRNGSLRSPAALARTRLSGRIGAALDPCAAIQVPVSVADGISTQVTFRLGMGRSTDEADELVQRFRGATAAQRALEAVRAHWSRTLGAVQVKTPDPAFDVLVNGWLLYQTIACRIWARSGFYQSGGAFGFRDQLQDAMALAHAQPAMLREQLLLCASRQFPEGDVQHWWHPPQGRGVRTRISDDYLWLPLALARYVEATGDDDVLAQSAPYLQGRPVNPHDESYYDSPGHSHESSTLYDHALRALIHGLRFGVHGLPLMGSGDWNDGMNLVGHDGRGESVWLGFFLAEVLERFGALAARHGHPATAARCASERAKLRGNLETHGWDGAWYRRAYFDDGTPLGSARNPECQIDSIAQSWSVLSGIAEPARAQQAMAALQERLVRPDAKLVQLLDPPFDQRGPNPGYIAGYVPGVRENGGQYTHAAIWAAMAFAALGENERAWTLLAMINPVRHGDSAEGVALYKVEPYVVAADVYSVAPHTGRGGWSWYTGSAGWMYRLMVESLLGLRLVRSEAGARLVVAPCLPAAWTHCTLQYRYRATEYEIEVLQQDGDGKRRELRLDGVLLTDDSLPLVDDEQPHRVQLTLTRRPEPQASPGGEASTATVAQNPA